MTITSAELATGPEPVRSRAPVGQWLTERLGRATAYSLAVYLATRLALSFGVVAAYLSHTHLTWSSFAQRRDGWWYLWIARHGYGHDLHLQVAGTHSHYSAWAFFPGYPMLLRFVHAVVPLPLTDEAYVVSFILGAVAVRAVYALGAAYGGDRVARGAALLVAAWPGSAAMNMPYSESLFIAATAGALAALLRRRWVLAGLLGLVSSATRPAGLAFVIAAVVAALLDVRKSRSWRALSAPALASLGVGGFVLYGWAETGDLFVWRHAEDLWHQHLDFGAGMFAHWAAWLPSRGGHAQLVLMEIGGLLLVLIFAAAAIGLRHRLNPALAAYGAVSLFMVLGYSDVGTRPRMVLAVLPGFVWLAAWLRTRTVEITGLAFASALALTAYLYMTSVTP